MSEFKGLIAAPFTPMHADGSLNTDLIAPYYEMLAFNNIAGAFINGSTGEGVSLTISEKKEVTEAWAAAVDRKSGFRLISLVGGNSITESIDLALHAKEQGCYAVAFTSPSYFVPANLDKLVECCVAIGKAIAPMPLYYYHIPVLTGMYTSMLPLLEKIDPLLDNFKGIKYTHEDFMDFLDCINYKSGKYEMLWGRDECLLSALAVGARGGVGSTYNYAAPLYHDLMDAYDSGDMQLARKLQQQAVDMIHLLPRYGGISVGKQFMKLVGLDCGEFRLPIKNPTMEQQNLFSADARKLNFRDYCSKLPALI